MRGPDIMKKIAILFPGNLKSISTGGIDRYVKSIIGCAENCEITVYGICEVGELEIGEKYDREYKGKKYTFIPICTNAKTPLSLYYTLCEHKWIPEMLNEYDIIYLQRIEFALPFAFKKKGTVSQIIHGSGKYYEYSYGKLRYLVYSILEHLSIIITGKTFVIMNNDRYGVPYYKRKYKKYSDRFYYAINPVTLDVFSDTNKNNARKELGFKDDENIVLYIGRIIDNPKRALLIPDICKHLNDMGITCTFITAGDGPDDSKLKKRIAEMGLESQVKCIGYIDDNELIAKYVKAADVTINMSMYEGTCTSNVESVACGTPVVSTDVGEIRELIHENYNGVVVSESDRDLIAVSMARGISTVLKGNIKMDDTYKKYEAKSAVSKLIQDLLKE